MQVKMVPVGQITIGERHRKDMGDLESLANSIDKLGLYHPIVVTPDNLLVVGERRLKACQDILGWQEIPAHILSVDAVVEGERDENEERKDFTPSEQVAIGKALEKLLGERRGRPKKINDTPDEISPGGDELNQDKPSGRTDEIAAAAAGFDSKRSYRDAARVVEKGSPELIEAMDREEVSISDAAAVAELPKNQQREAVKKVKEKKAKTLKAAVKQESPPEEEKPPDPPKDDVGIPVSGRMAEVFEVREKYREAKSLYRQLNALVNDIAQSRGGELYRKRLQVVKRGDKTAFHCPDLRKSLALMEPTEPYSSVCPSCHHRGKVARDCMACLGLGWVPKGVFDNAADEHKAAVKEMAP